MKKIIISLLFFLLCSPVVIADSFRFEWEEGSTYIEVPLNANINDYIYKPKAKLFRNNIWLTEAEIHLVPNGDWLYLLTDVDTSVEGEYLVWYKAVENVYKPGQCQGYKTLVTFVVIDDKEPVIDDCPKKIIYRIGSEKPNYLSNVIAHDNSGEVRLDYYDGEVNYNKVGEYNVYIYAVDKHYKTTKTIVLCVVDNEGPKIEFLGENNTIIIDVGEALNLKQYFKAIDDADGDVLYTIRYDEINTNFEGIYQTTVYFNDTQGNISEYSLTINIVDNNELNIDLIEENILLDYKVDLNTFNFLNNVSNAYYGSVDIKDKILIDVGSIKNEVGVYQITYYYEIKDKKVSQSCYVHLLSNEPPIINLTNVEVTIGERVNFDEYIEVIDPSDKDILNSVKVDDLLVEYNREGTYPVYVTATNSSGLSTTKILYVNVNKPKLNIDHNIILIGLVIVYLFLEKIIRVIKRRNN